jgi:hypothetical protein
MNENEHRLAGYGDHALTEIRRFQMAEKPPSTANSTPFTKLESSEARNSATVAISSGRPIFPRGIRDSNSCLVSLSIRWESGVSICPGLSTFTRIFLPFGSLSHVRANERQDLRALGKARLLRCPSREIQVDPRIDEH